MAKSAYVLELSVPPGGEARRGDLFVYGHLDQVRQALTREFLSPDPNQRAMAAFLSIWYGENIMLWLVQDGALVGGLDLHPALSVRIGSMPPIRLDDERRLNAIRQQVPDVAAIFEAGMDLTFELDWEPLARQLPPIQGEMIKPGEETELAADRQQLAQIGSYLQLTDGLLYGEMRLEGEQEGPPGGGGLAGLPFEDEAPPPSGLFGAEPAFPGMRPPPEPARGPVAARPPPPPEPEPVRAPPPPPPPAAPEPQGPPMSVVESHGRLLVRVPVERFSSKIADTFQRKSTEAFRAGDQLSPQQRQQLQRDGAGFVTPLEFFSEVELNERPLDRKTFDANARELVPGFRVLEARLPRFGAVLVVDRNGKRFITNAATLDPQVIDSWVG